MPRCFIDTNVVVSEDLNSGQWYGGVQVVNPFADESPR